MIRLYLWFCRVLFVARGPWVRWAPGLPCALLLLEGVSHNDSGAIRVAGMPSHIRRHCEERSDEAIHSFFTR